MDKNTGAVHTWKDVTARVEIVEPSEIEIVKVRISEDLARFYGIGGRQYGFRGCPPRPDFPVEPGSVLGTVLGQIGQMAANHDTMEVAVERSLESMRKVLDQLVELGHLEMIEGS